MLVVIHTPALDVLLTDLDITLDQPQAAMARLRNTLVGLSPSPTADSARRRGQLGADVRVRHLIGLDPKRLGVAVADTPEKMLALGLEELTDRIKTIGLFRQKAKNVIRLSQILVEDFGGEVVERTLVGAPHVHARTATDRLQPFEHLDRGGIVTAGGFG